MKNKIKKFVAITLGTTMLLGTTITANAYGGYTDFISTRESHSFQLVAYVNCTNCQNINAPHYKCSAHSDRIHYKTVCNVCGTTVEYNN